MSERPKYHFISHSHWDREWYLSFEEFRVRLVQMIDDLMVRMREDPDFRAFLFDGQMAMIMDYLEIRPETRTEIRSLVEKGRLSIGPWYILSDEFLPSGESHVRNLLLGNLFAREFGSTMKVGYLPDQFGHIAQMPQLLHGFGIDTALIYRGFGGEPGQNSSEYEWRAPDGSTVLMLHLPKDGYSFAYFARDTDDEMLRRFERLRKEIDTRARTPHRLVLNGGDHFWPDEKLAEALRLFSRHYDADFDHVSLPAFVALLKEELHGKALPDVSGELREGLKHAFAVLHGTASSRMPVKQENHACELLLEKQLEPLNAIAVMLGAVSRRHLIRQAWKYLLQNQDHDVICGASVDPVYREAGIRFDKIRQIVRQAQKDILEDIVPLHGDRHGDDRTILLYNLLPFPRSGIIECEMEFHLQDVVIGINPDAKPSERVDPPAGFTVCSMEGEEIPYQQLVARERYALALSKDAYPAQTRVHSVRVLIDPGRLPSFGYKSFRVLRTDRSPEYASRVRAGERWIENDMVRVDVQPDGSLSITDRAAGRVASRMNLFEDGGDIGDGYTWCPPEHDRTIASDYFPPVTEILEAGPLRATVSVSWSLILPARANRARTARDLSEVTVPLSTCVSVTAGSRRVDIRTTVENNAEDHRFRVLFHTDLEGEISYAHGQFAMVRRIHRAHDWTEYPYEKPVNLHPMKQGVTILDGDKGFTLFTRGIPEYELSTDGSGLLALTLLRCVGQLSASNLATRPGGDAGWKNATPDSQCPGRHVFEYALLLHDGATTFDEVLREAQLFDAPIVADVRKHEPPDHAERSFAELEGNRVVWSTCKEAEEGRDMVLRVYNPTATAARASFGVSFANGGIRPTDLSESIQPDEQPVEGNNYVFHLPPYAIRTLQIRRHE